MDDDDDEDKDVNGNGKRRGNSGGRDPYERLAELETGNREMERDKNGMYARR